MRTKLKGQEPYLLVDYAGPPKRKKDIGSTNPGTSR